MLVMPSEIEGQYQEYSVKNITVDDGLPQSSIVDIFQDSDGYIWLATEDGLIRYDGYEFKPYQYRPGDSTSIRRSFVYLIAEDNEGYLWVSLLGDLIDKFDKKTEEFILVDDIHKIPPDIRDYFFKRDKEKKKYLYREAYIIIALL